MPDSIYRKDGTLKGRGYLGELKRPNGGVSTELSIGVDFGGREIEIPSLVPTLNKAEVDYLLSIPTDQRLDRKHPVAQSILKKAVDHAKTRLFKGMSPFYQEDKFARPRR